jgi:translocation and assembly module TamB
MIPSAKITATSESPQTPRRSAWLRWVVRGVLVLFGLFLLFIAGIAIYSTTDDFQRRVGGEVKQVLEDATGGRVELGHVSFNVWHLAVEADNLVIHGTEPPDQMPYLSVAKAKVRLKIHTFLTHLRGVGPQSHISLSYLGVEQPHVHLIIDKNGKTNQPVPKHPSQSSEPIQDTLIDLQARTVELSQGLAVINDRAIPFDLAAKDLSAEVHYLPKSDSYGASIELADLKTKMAAQPTVQSKLKVVAELGRDAAKLTSLDFVTGASTHLTASGQLIHFANPAWQVAVKGGLELKQVGYLTGTQGLTGGTLDLNLNGQSCVVAAPKPQKRPFWRRKNDNSVALTVQPPDPGCTNGYSVSGPFVLHQVGYRTDTVRFRDINGNGILHITPDELAIPSIRATLPGGGTIDGVFRIADWLKPVSHSSVTATVTRVPLRTIMDTTATENYGDLGFDTSITGPTTVSWDSSTADVGQTVKVDAKLQFLPLGSVRAGALNNLPITGFVTAQYDGKREVVSIAQIHLRSPATSLDASGVLGVDKGDPLTDLQVNLQARDLGEFDQLLHTLDLEAFNKKGTAAIPVVLHGTLGFTGTAKGVISDLDVKGHATADNLVLTLPGIADTHIDSVLADFEYSPNSGVAVASSTIRRNTAVLNLGGSFKPQKVVSRKGAVSYAWDENGTIDADAKLANAQLTDLLEIAGQQQAVPVTGTVNVNVHAAGDIHDLKGGGSVALANGVAYGESYQSLSLNVAAKGQEIDATSLQLRAHNLLVSGSAGYNLTTKHITANLSGNGLQLSKFDTFSKASPNADGVLTFTASVNGTAEEPGLNAKLGLTNVTVQGKPIGELSANATSSGSSVSYQLQSKLVGAQLEANGQTSLTGDYDTQAKLSMSGIDIANAIALFSPGSLKGSSDLSGFVTVSGPLRKPQQISGSLEFQRVDVKLENVELRSAAPLRASLRDGTVSVDQFHITGQDTDLIASGTAKVLGDTNAQGGALKLSANGNISMALAHSFDKDITSSGKVGFKVDVGGRMKQPELSGNVQLQNVNLALDGIANGLSAMNGTLVFNEGRLDVKDLTATTGGGQLKIGGYLAYQKGLFGDLTATGDAVRVRLYGLSSTANASLRLQGTPQSMRLSGNVLITRFGVGPDVDFAAFAGAAGPQIPPPRDAPTNKILLDVHVTSAPQLDFQNSYAKLAGTVDLTARGTLAMPTVLGRIQITEGNATYLGTKYQLERGSVTFSNPVRIDPVIDLDASARVENYDVNIGLHGTTTSLKPTYRSEPPLTEADIFNLLALGRTQEEAQISNQQQTQAGSDPTTNALLGGALNATVSSRVGKLFGGATVKIDPSFVGSLGTSAARITVTEPIAKQVTLVFATNVNQSAQQLIQVQYRLNQSTSIVATRDENGVFSIVYKLRKRYR